MFEILEGANEATRLLASPCKLKFDIYGPEQYRASFGLYIDQKLVF